MITRGAALAICVISAGCGTASTDVAFDEPVVTLFGDAETGAVVGKDSAVLGVDDVDPADIPAPRHDAPGVVDFESLLAPIVAAASGAGAATWTIETPCGARRSGDTPAAESAVVVLDPTGDAATASGVRALTRNSRLATLVRDRLSAAGISTVSTRNGTADVAAPYRRAAADAAGARVVVSIALVDGVAALGPEPALEIVHPAADIEARRLSGLIHAAVLPVAERLDIGWPTDVEPGVRAVLNQRGSDYFVVLQESSGAARAVLHLPVDPTMIATVWANDRDLVAVSDAIADAIVRYLVTDDEGSGFVAPTEIVRQALIADPATTCVDPLAADMTN